MSAIVLTPGNVRVTRLRILQCVRGVWLADLELDPGRLEQVPKSGKVKITLSNPKAVFTLLGTIDPRGTGTFLEVPQMRVLGGGAGWDKTVPPQHYHSDGGGLRDVDIYSTTATLVGEVVHVQAPAPIGSPDFFRSGSPTMAAGPASRVFGNRDWWVDVAGVTQVGTRPAAVADASMVLLRWDPSTQTAELVSDTLVFPNTTISDPRILGGPVTIRDVEQVFDAQGSTVTAWCGVSPTAQLMNDLRSMVAEFSGKRFLATYPYRIVIQGSDGRLQLQAVDPPAGMPDTLPLSPWTGLSGGSCKYKLGSLVRVSFLEGDPSKPIVDSYQPGAVPRESTVDATLAVHVGPGALAVDLAGGMTPLVPAPWASGLAAALTTFAASLSTAAVGPLAPLGTLASALTSALGSLPAPATTKVTAQ